jgi:Na+/melibiose symporter-like transporter
MTTTLATDGRQREYLESLRGLSVHVAIFAIVNLLIFLIDMLTRGSPWFFYPLLGWGCGVVMHAEAVLSSRQSRGLALRTGHRRH